MSDGENNLETPGESPETHGNKTAEGVEVYKRAPQTPKAHFFVTLTHWAMVTLLTLALLSGMRIGWGFTESPLGGEEGIWADFLQTIAPRGNIFGIPLIHLHVTLAIFMVAVSVLYAVYMLRSRASRRLRLTGKDMQKLQAGLKTAGFLRNKQALWSANLVVYWIAFIFIAVLFASGVSMYYLQWHLTDWGPMKWIGGYTTVRLVHGIVAYLLVPYAIVHSLLQWFFGRFWSIFKAQFYRPHMRAGGVALLFGFAWFGWLFAWNDMPTTMTVWRMPATVTEPVLDGVADDPAWQYAESTTIRTTKGVNNPKPFVDVTVKSIHDAKNIYFMFQWKDPDVSYKRFPLRKTVDGWEVLQTNFDTFDESVYYEDKLSVYFTDVANGSCAKSCHMGVGPAAEKGDKHGVHYTNNGEYADVWHWKSVRTNNMAGDDQPGWTDDQFIGPPTPIPAKLKADQRWTGGYDTDKQPGGKGGYSYNFKKLAQTNVAKPSDHKDGLFAGAHYVGGAEFKKNLVQPIMLPREFMINVDPNPATSEENSIWWIRKSEGIPYEESLDKYPVGSVIPNILLEPFKGDRADVRAKGKWKNGYWTLETKRVLDTGSKFDVPFKIDKPVYISVAAYNRTQTRHSEHIRPLQLMLRNTTKKVGTN